MESSLKVDVEKKYIWPQLARTLDQIIAVSGVAKRQLLDNYPLKPDQVTAVYNGINHEQFSPLAETAVDEVFTNLGVERPYYVSVNSYTERKNPETLIQAFDAVADTLPEYSFLIAGPGWEKPKVNRLLRESDNDDRIHRLGTVPYEALPALYTGATAIVSPTYQENFGLTLAESMACGTPVIASNVFAVPETVGNGGILIDDPEDTAGFAAAMERLATHDELRAEYEQSAQEQASRYTWERCASDVLDVYESMVD